MLRSHTVLSAVALLVGVALAACAGPSPSATPSGTAAPTATPIPSATPSSVPASISPPLARQEAAMGYDPVGKRLLLFGGNAAADLSHPLADTWAWDGTRWTQLHPAHTPPAEVGAGLVLDPVSGHLVLVGGYGPVDANHFPQQTGMWGWDGTDWSRIADNPIQDACVNAASDPHHKQVLLDAAGDTGAGQQSPPPTYTAGAYVWNGSAWSSAPSHLTGGMTVMGSHCAGIAYDEVSGRVIEFGGYQQASFGDTLAWDGTSWSTIQSQGLASPSPDQPPPGAALAADDVATGHIVLLAGSTSNPALATTWSFTGTSWTRQLVNEPPPLDGAAIAYDPDVGGVVIFGGTRPSAPGATSPFPSNTMYLWRGNGWSALPTS